MMGDEYQDRNGWDEELPVHSVNIKAFWIGKYPVTQALWKRIMNNNPSKFRGEDKPVEMVSWDDIKGKDNFLDQLLKISAKSYRLPSEAEWEYAAKANQKHKYSGSDNLKEVGWYRKNGHDETKPVDLKAPNDFGLFDMNGNVWEWCEDDWHENYQNAPDDGSAWIDNPRALFRVRRGGSYFFSAQNCRPSCRSGNVEVLRYGDIGFRLVFSQSGG
jgi:formylglycine-generating enzyme required for sulfatase activity